MGVKGWNFLPWKVREIETISPKTIAIDFPNYMIRRMSQVKTRNFERIPLAHVSITLGFIRAALKSNIKPVFVFDGPPEKLKRHANPRLVKDASRLYNAFKQDEDPYDIDIAERLHQSRALWSYFAQAHIMDLCISLGIPAVSAPSEAELFGAVLARDGLVGMVVTTDVDALLFGSPSIARSISLTKGEMESVSCDDILSQLELDLGQLRDLAILCGCDFHPGLKGIGPRKGTILLQRYGSLEPVLEAQGLNNDEIESFLLAREVYDEAGYLETKNVDLRIRPPAESKLERMLSHVIGSTRAKDRASEFVRLWKNFGREQTTLEMWT